MLSKSAKTPAVPGKPAKAYAPTSSVTKKNSEADKQKKAKKGAAGEAAAEVRVFCFYCFVFLHFFVPSLPAATEGLRATEGYSRSRSPSNDPFSRHLDNVFVAPAEKQKERDKRARHNTRSLGFTIAPPPLPHNNKNSIIHQAAPAEIKVKSKPVKQEKANKKGAADEAGEAIAKGKGKH